MSDIACDHFDTHRNIDTATSAERPRPTSLPCAEACSDPSGSGKPVPPYLAHRGWVGAWLDVKGIDWDRVEALLVDA
jgi:hypothetical protein